MSETNYFLFLDESGNFKDKDSNFSEASLVGGILFKDNPKNIKEYIIEKNLIQEDETFHSTEKKDPEKQIQILKELKQKNIDFVIFTNSDRVSVVNSDRVYLNVLSDGLIKLLKKLTSKDKVSLYVTVASRQIDEKRESKNKFVSYDLTEYINLIIEHLIMQGTKINIDKTFYEEDVYTKIKTDNFDLNINRKCATKKENKLLMCADVVCNTYFTRKTKKFKNCNIKDIEKLYSKKYIISAFTGNNVSYLEYLLDNNNYSEILLEIASLKKDILEKNESLKNFILVFLEKFKKISVREQNINFEYVSQRISLIENNLDLIINYKDFICTNFPDKKFIHFDICFHLATKYSHLGNILESERYIKKCRKELKNLDISWNNFFYCYEFNIREINMLIDSFQFDEALNKSKELYNDINSLYSNIKLNMSFDIVAKTLGLQVRCYFNLLKVSPNYLEQARKMSNLSIEKFKLEEDKKKQYQFRALLENEAKNPNEALRYFVLSLDCKENFKDIIKEIETLLQDKKNYEVGHNLMHYTNIMLNYRINTNKLDISSTMYEALKSSTTLYSFLTDITNISGPLLLALWNLAKYCLVENNDDSIYKIILDYQRTQEILIIDSLMICVFADYISYNLSKENNIDSKYIEALKKEYRKFICSPNVPDNVKKYFNINLNLTKLETETKKLQELSQKYLR